MNEQWRVVVGCAIMMLFMYGCIFFSAQSTREDWENYRFHTIETRLWGLTSGLKTCFFFLMMWLCCCVFFFWMCLMEPDWFGWKAPLAVLLVAFALPVAYYEYFRSWVRKQLEPWKSFYKKSC